jgi:uncharacterized phage protein (TIGR02218 family)
MDTLSTIALTWRVERRDGIAIGLTSHDRDLEIDGFGYRAAPGMTPSAVRRSADLDADTMDVSGALSGAAIAERDLLAGRWDGARVVMRAVDWSDGSVIAELGEGRIGAVELRDGEFTAELAGIATLLDGPVSESTSPECRAELGDRRCRVAMAGRRRFVRVVSVDEAVLTVDAEEPLANAYGGGLARWFGGANSGLGRRSAHRVRDARDAARPDRARAGRSGLHDRRARAGRDRVDRSRSRPAAPRGLDGRGRDPRRCRRAPRGRTGRALALADPGRLDSIRNYDGDSCPDRGRYRDWRTDWWRDRCADRTAHRR